MTQDFYPHEHFPAATAAKPGARPKKKRQRSYSLAWLEEPYNYARGEMSLWVAVITQAVMDALSRTDTSEANYYKHEAVHWLTGNSKDFVFACMCAGLNPDYVRRQAKRSLIAPMPWRAEPGKGERYLERKNYRKKYYELQKRLRKMKKDEDASVPDAASKIIPLRRS